MHSCLHLPACHTQVRLARYPCCVEASLSHSTGTLALLLHLISASPPMIAQIAVFALYKLCRPGPHQSGALLGVVKAGGVAALVGGMQCLEERTSRDMAASVLLDAALVQQVGAGDVQVMEGEEL